MNEIKLKRFTNEITSECLKLISIKNVKIKDLAYKLGISVEQFYNNIAKGIKDVSFYLETYNILLEWQVS